MLAKVCSAAVTGIEAYPVEVEVNAGYGDTLIVIVVNKTPKPPQPDSGWFSGGIVPLASSVLVRNGERDSGILLWSSFCRCA